MTLQMFGSAKCYPTRDLSEGYMVNSRNQKHSETQCRLYPPNMQSRHVLNKLQQMGSIFSAVFNLKWLYYACLEYNHSEVILQHACYLIGCIAIVLMGPYGM